MIRSICLVFALACLVALLSTSGAFASESGLVVPEVGAFPLTEIGQKDLVSDQIFMRALWGMRIEKCAARADSVEVVTTGAVFSFNSTDSTLQCRQRIGAKRQTLSVRFPAGLLSGLSVAAKDTGAVILKSSAGLTVKVNCDSMLMLRTASPALLDFSIPWKPAVDYEYGSHHLLIDPFGAVAILPIREAGLQSIQTKQQHSYELGANGELWVSIGPPRPYRWKDSLGNRLIWQGTWQKPEYANPSDDKIKKWAPYGNILWLQSEYMMWKSWHEAFEPRFPDELARVVKTAHSQKQRVMAYFSPYYFTGGIGGEYTNTGENIGQYFQAVNDFRTKFPTLDGFYFDGVYPGSVEQTYRICRAMRAYLGPKRFFMIHCTGNAPGGLVYNPAADTYSDMILRGEGQGFISDEWLRYFVSGYNISNSVGVVCNNSGDWIATPRQIEMTLRANCRLAYMPFESEEFPTGTVRIVNLPPTEVEARIRKNLQTYYWPKLNKDYPRWLERVNASSDYAVRHNERMPLGVPRHPLNGLKASDLRGASKANLVYHAFGVDNAELATEVSVNGVSIGSLPSAEGDKWTLSMRLPLSEAALRTIGSSNKVVIANPNRDAFKLRHLYLEFLFPDGRRATTQVDWTVYASTTDWLYTEGFEVQLGDPIAIELPVKE